MLWTHTKGEPEYKYSAKKRILVRVFIGISLLMIPLILTTVDPIHSVILYATKIKNGTFLFDIFQSELEGARLQLYVFNATNAERFLSGDDYKLKVEEVGPFTYVETRRNGDVELNEEDGEVWFTPNMKVKFLPELSVGDPRDVMVTVPNLALMSASSLVSKYSLIIRTTFNLIAGQLGSKIINTMDAHSFLWGKRDPLIGLANRVVPGLIYFDKLGIIDRLYDEKSYYRIKMSINNHDKFSIKTLNKYLKGSNYLVSEPIESYNFNDTYEGASFPPGLTKTTPLNIYRIGVCRPFTLEYKHDITMDYGPLGWVYNINNETFNRDCGIEGGICGILDLSKCTFGIPIAISRTHFLNTDPKIYERIEGMKPDPIKHESVFVLEEKLGFELATNLSLQLNMAMGDVSFNRQTARFSNMTVPIAYIEVIQPKVFDSFKTILKIVHVHAPNILLCIEIILFIISSYILIQAIKIYYKNKSGDIETNIISVHEKAVPLLK